MLNGRELGVAVLSLGAEEGLEEAVVSLLEQELRPEIVVVNSGGGGAEDRLRAAGLDVPVIEREERLLPGGARNLGLAALEAPYVGFLAADCRAEPGWVAGRLRKHREGALAVSSFLTNAFPESRTASAAALLLHHRRMAHAPEFERLHNGLSYARELFDRFGLFREDLRTGEDTEFKRRLVGVEVAWTPEVRTAHRNPRRPADLLREQYGRGRRTACARRTLDSPVGRPGGLPLEVLIDASRAWRYTALEPDPSTRRALRRGWPLVAPAAVAYAAGALRA